MAYSRSKERKPIPAGLWLFLFGFAAFIFWYLRWPGMPMLWLGLLTAGATAQYPTPPNKSTPPDEGKLHWFKFWKACLAGFIPSRDWLNAWRVAWWFAWAVGFVVSMNSPYPATLAANVIAGFWTVMAFLHGKDRWKDPRHPYTGVSVKSFLGKAPIGLKLGVLIPTVLLTVAALLLWYLEYANAGIIALPLMLFLLLVWLLDRKRQTAQWRQMVEWQLTVDGWINAEDSPMQKPWRNARVTQLNVFGDENPLTVIRLRLDRGVGEVMKAGVDAVLPSATENGYNFVCLMNAKQKKQGQEMFDPNCVRLALGQDETCVPDVTLKKAGEKLATLVADIAYSKTAADWRKTAPLCKAHDVSAEEGDEARAAWLITFTMPPSGGESMQRISIDWLDTDGDPGTWIKLPVFADIYYKFHLYAEPDVPLSDAGNKWREPNVVTEAKEFSHYMETSRRFKQDQTVWESITTGSRVILPSPSYDGEKVRAGNGWTVDMLPLELHAPTTADDIARLDLRPLNPMAVFIGVVENGMNAVLVTVTGKAAPTRLDQLNGNAQQHRMLANAMGLKAFIDVAPRSGSVQVSQCTNEGRDVPIWRMTVTVGGGATIQDLRRKSAAIQSSIGAARIYWNWKTTDTAEVWFTGENSMLALEDMHHWKKSIFQKQLIELALSESWGAAGVTDASGDAPKVTSLGVLPNNRSVLQATFDLPRGLNPASVDANKDKFLTASGYSYGRVLPKSDTDAPTVFSMILAKQSPFPKLVNADWDLARQGDGLKFPLGVNDLGNPVFWEVKGTPHIAIMGKTGTGKSSAAQIVVAEALLHGYQLIIIDPTKGAVDFDQWARPKALAFVGLKRMRETEAVIAWVENEMNRRSQINAEYGVGNILDLPEDVRPERMMILFDEFNNYISNMSKTAPNPNNDLSIANDNANITNTNNSIRRTMASLSRIALAGRSLGISIVLGAQRISTDDMRQFSNGSAFWRSTGRILLGADATIGVVSPGNLSAANRLQNSLKGEGGLIPQGRGLFESAQGQLNAVQTWWSGDQDKLTQVVADVPDAEPIDYAKYMPKQAEQYGEVTQAEAEQVDKNEGPTITREDLDDAEELDW